MTTIGAVLTDRHDPGDAARALRFSALLRSGSMEPQHWSNDRAAIVVQGRTVTQRDLHGCQPVVHPSGVVGSAFARIRNFSQLADELRHADRGFRLDSDADVCVAAYCRWGDTFVDHLVGTFAVVVYDPKRSSLIGAVDHLGKARLFAHATSHGVAFATEPRPLAALGWVRAPVDERFVVGTLLRCPVDPELTEYTGISRVPPGNVWRLGIGGSVDKRRYWRISCTPRVRRQTDAEYAEEFRELVRQSTVDACDSVGGIGLELSGGLDSSLIAAIAARNIEGGVPLSAGAHVHNARRADEREFSRSVASHSGLRLIEVPGSATPAGWHERLNTSSDALMSIWDAYNIVQVADELRGHDCRVLLTGQFGDQLFDSYLSGHVRQFGSEPLRAARAVGHYIRWNGLMSTARMFASEVLPPRIVTRVSSRRATPALLGPLLRNSDVYCALIEARASYRAELRPGAERRFEPDISGPGAILVLDSLNRLMDGVGVEYRHPLHDRHVVEFSVRLPESQRSRPGEQTRVVHRAAMEGIVPESVRRRTTKGEFSHVAREVVLSPGVDFYQSGRAAAAGWINASEAGRRFAEVQAGGSPWLLHGLWAVEQLARRWQTNWP